MGRDSSVDRLSQRLFESVAPHVPLAVKRPLKRAIPRRLHHYVDRDWHRYAVGGLWEELGKLQFDYLVEQGLRPEHRFLDIGCGSLRGGVHFIRYLEPGNYVGIEKEPEILRAGREVELPRYGLEAKEPLLVQMDNFDFASLGRTFDVALAQSVFTHIPLNAIIRCVINVEKVLAEGGRFYATFWENERGKFNLDDVHQAPHVVTHFDRDFFHYDFATFEWICDGTKLEVKYLGDWGNPRNQKMIVFTRV